MANPSVKKIIYPESDGKPMAENTKQYRWITVIKGNLDILFRDRADVFVAGDLLWYPVEGQPGICTAPDVLVALGRPKGDRGSYQQWQEGGQPPQVVFEILSPGNRDAEMTRKAIFYQLHGVQEYYLYDPEEETLAVFLRAGDRLVEQKYNTSFRKSPLLGITFDFVGDDGGLRLFYPDGQPFLGFEEFATKLEAERTARLAEQAARELEQAARRAAEELAEAEKTARQAAEEARQTAEELAEAEKTARQTAEAQLLAERQAKEEERKAKEEEQRANAEALAELARLRAELAQAKK
jgi:Uma2 family endonuclease